MNDMRSAALGIAALMFLLLLVHLNPYKIGKNKVKFPVSQIFIDFAKLVCIIARFPSVFAILNILFAK